MSIGQKKTEKGFLLICSLEQIHFVNTIKASLYFVPVNISIYLSLL
jgi:hypothetical protein